MALANTFSIMSQDTPPTSITDVTPPTFAGVVSNVQQPNGSLLASWATATDPTNPITYDIFIKPLNATGLFLDANLCGSTKKLSFLIFRDGQDQLLTNQVYYVGVRARDGVGNQETNTVSVPATSLGVLPDNLAIIAAALASTQALFAATEASLQVTDSNLLATATDFATTQGEFEATEAALEAAIVDIENAATSIAASSASIASSASQLTGILTSIADYDIVGTVDDDLEVVGTVEEN